MTQANPIVGLKAPFTLEPTDWNRDTAWSRALREQAADVTHCIHRHLEPFGFSNEARQRAVDLFRAHYWAGQERSVRRSHAETPHVLLNDIAAVTSATSLLAPLLAISAQTSTLAPGNGGMGE